MSLYPSPFSPLLSVGVRGRITEAGSGSCFGRANTSNVCSEGVEGTSDAGVAGNAKHIFEVALELKHVAETAGARKIEGSETLGARRRVAHLLTERLVSAAAI